MPPRPSCLKRGTPYPEVTGSICRVPSTSFSQAPEYTLLIHQCWFGVRSIRVGYFLEVLHCTFNPIRMYNLRPSSPHTGQGILTLFPSTTAFALALGADLPCLDYHWTGNLGFSATESFTLFNVTYVSILTSNTSSSSRESAFTGLWNAPLPRHLRDTRRFGV